MNNNTLETNVVYTSLLLLDGVRILPGYASIAVYDYTYLLQMQIFIQNM